MKNHIKRIVINILAFFIVFIFFNVIFTMPVKAADTVASGTCGADSTWVLDSNGKLTISGSGRVDWGHFNSYKANIYEVEIQDGITSIGWYAFQYFNKIYKVTLPASVTDIGPYAFNECHALKELHLSNGLEKIDEYAFNRCINLNRIELPDTVKIINANAFSYCSKLTTINIPPQMTKISGYTFYHCNSLTTVYIPENIKVIGARAFEGCSGITTLTISENVEEIAESAFRECSGLTEINIPKTLKIIDSCTFKGCVNLKSVTIPEGVISINDSAFYNCKKLESVILPSSLQTIEISAFNNCEALSSVIIKSVQEIKLSAFSGCISLTAITIPKDCSKIGDRAFDSCTNLKEINILGNLDTISYMTFANCTSLEKIVIPSTIKSIETDAFKGCSKLDTIIFQGSAPSMANGGYWATEGATSGGGGYQVWVDATTFDGVTANAYYPQSDTTWTKEVREKDYGGKITWIGYESDLTTPAKPYKIANVVSGVHVYWNAVSGATKYGLWRSETGANGSYKWVGNPTTNHFTDTKVESGKTYYYCVSTCNPKTNAHSIISEPLGITYVSTPDITNRMNLAAGVKLTWNKINGATGYAIYRKPYTGNAAWVRVETISGNETFTWTDKSVASANGTLYRYTIRALAGTNMKTLSGCRNTGRTMARLTSRTLNSVTKTAATSVKCTWSTTAQASGYEVRFMNGSTVVKQFTVGNYKTGAKTFTGIPTGANYKVQVRSYKKVDGVGVFYSAWSTPKYVNL